MELKIVCNCGQKFAFDVEPVKGRMPVSVFCPACGRDGTQTANDVLAQHFPDQAPPIPLAITVQPAVAAAPTPPVGRLQINRSAPAAGGAPPPLPPRVIAPLQPVATKPKLAWYEYLWIGLPLLLIAIGGAIGGACGGAACALNRTVFLKTRNPILRYVWTGLISATAFVVWLIIAAILIGFLHRG
jgi:hypothetical protein